MSRRRSAPRGAPIRLTEGGRQGLTFKSAQGMDRGELKFRLNKLGGEFRTTATDHELRWLLLGIKEQESDQQAAARRRSPKKRGKRKPGASGVTGKATPEKLKREGVLLMQEAEEKLREAERLATAEIEAVKRGGSPKSTEKRSRPKRTLSLKLRLSLGPMSSVPRARTRHRKSPGGRRTPTVSTTRSSCRSSTPPKGCDGSQSAKRSFLKGSSTAP